VLKKVGLVAAIAVTATVGLGSVAFADSFNNDDHDGGPLSGHVIQHKINMCDESILSGKLQVPNDEDSDNSSDNDTDCDQHLTPEED
jgi:hypothetical protein